MEMKPIKDAWKKGVHEGHVRAVETKRQRAARKAMVRWYAIAAFVAAQGYGAREAQHVDYFLRTRHQGDLPQVPAEAFLVLQEALDYAVEKVAEEDSIEDAP